MANTILPESGGNQNKEILHYLNADGLRQLVRQSRLHWHLKPNKDCDFYDNQTLYKYTGELHNEAVYQRMEIHTYPDNGAYHGYAGINIDSGTFGLVHDMEKWNEAMSDDSVGEKGVGRVQIAAMARIPKLTGMAYDNGEIRKDSHNRMAGLLMDPFDGRTYVLSNDDTIYVNNEKREKRLPGRTLARICDIPTHMTDLKNDLDFVADHDYHHTDNNFTNSNRFILDNIDDRTFVYPEISRNVHGEYLENKRFGLSGDMVYGESDGSKKMNTQFGHEDRIDHVITSHNYNKKFSGRNPRSGFLPGIFRSVEELNKVDLLRQKRIRNKHEINPGSRRSQNYYLFDGIWSPTWFDRIGYKDSYLAQSLHPLDMTTQMDSREPRPYEKLYTDELPFDAGQLYQWRYNRVSVTYRSKDLAISIVEAGREYRKGDILRKTFGDDVILYEVTQVGINGQILAGVHKEIRSRIYEQDPSTHGVGIHFSNTSGVGYGAKLAILCKAHIEVTATQLKNNLYAYVDITPSVRSENNTDWSDNKLSDDQGGKIVVRSTAAGPAFSGINSGRGGPTPNVNSSHPALYEHGGNATAGVHVHLFRYVIDTLNPRWAIVDGVQVFLGQWVDQGPLGVERPCDIKALLFSNPDTNNFNNYYKFTVDNLIDTFNRDPDGVTSSNNNAISLACVHIAQKDPDPDQRFTDNTINPMTGKVEEVDITQRVFYVNAATGILFTYNAGYKNDPNFGYGNRGPGWHPIAGAITK